MKQPRSVIAFLGIGAGLVAASAQLARQRRIARRLEGEIGAMRTELTARDEELIYTVTVSIPGALEALHNRDLTSPPPFRPDIAETDRGRKLKSITDQIVASDERYLDRVEKAVKGALRTVMRRVQSLAAEQQLAISTMEDQHDNPDVLEGLLRMDHMNSQLGRRAQAIAVLCGGWPGQQRSAASLADVVRGANSRIRDYRRVEIPTHSDIGVIARVVEPVVLTLAELLDNATRHSEPGTSVQVTFRQDQDGMFIVIDDAGVGMSAEALTRAEELLSGLKTVNIHELGEPPQVGFAVIGVLAARYGFVVSIETLLDEGPNSHGTTRAVVCLPNALLTPIDESDMDAAAMRSATKSERPGVEDWIDPSDGDSPYQTTSSGLPVRRRRHAIAAVEETEATDEPEPVETDPNRATEQAAALGAWQRGTRRHDSEGNPGT